MKVKNINGTAQLSCSCTSWLAHWERFSGQTATYCCEEKCLNKDLVGAHVQMEGSNNGKWYIIPLCNAHNRAGGSLTIIDAYKLVSANKAETCAKW